MTIRIHGCAQTTPSIRTELQATLGSNLRLAKLYGINVKTVAKWRSRDTVLDLPRGPRSKGNEHLSAVQEVKLSLSETTGASPDDLMGQLLCTAPKLSRSAWHRCLQHLDINRLSPKCCKPKCGQFEATALGFVHIT